MILKDWNFEFSHHWKSLAGLVLLACFSSCFFQEIEIEFPAEPPKIMVLAPCVAGEIPKVGLATSRAIEQGEPVYYNLDSAHVHLLEEDRVIDTLYATRLEDFGRYFTIYQGNKPFQPVPGRRYRIVVSATDLPAARSESVLFRKDLDVKVEPTYRISASQDSIYNVRLNLIDNPSFTDSYRVSWYFVRAGDPQRIGTIYYYDIFKFIEDNRRNGTVVVDLPPMSIEHYGVVDSTTNTASFFPKDSLLVQVIRYGEEFDAYMRSGGFAVTNQVGGLFPGGEAVYSNIDGGYGYFAVGERDSLAIPMQP